MTFACTRPTKVNGSCIHALTRILHSEGLVNKVFDFIMKQGHCTEVLALIQKSYANSRIHIWASMWPSVDK